MNKFMRGVRQGLPWSSPEVQEVLSDVRAAREEWYLRNRGLDLPDPGESPSAVYEPAEEEQPPPKLNVLSPEAALLMSKATVEAARAAADEAMSAVRAYYKEAEESLQAVERWSEIIISNAQKMAEEIAKKHAKLRKAAKVLNYLQRRVIPFPPEGS